MSPPLRVWLAAGESGKSSALSALSSRRYAVYEEASGVWSADVFFVTASPQNISAPGVRIMARVGSITAARVTVSGLRALVESPAVRFIDISRKSASMSASDKSIYFGRVPFETRGFQEAGSGEGALIGLVDTGIDFTHPDLNDSTGTRILYLWDMSDVDNANAPTGVDPSFDWGREYAKTEIDASPEQVIQRDGDGGGGHGTHVAGIAAGSGPLPDEREGMAPAANLIVVKALRTVDSGGGFSDADVLAACDYIFKRAEELGMPAVINLSLGHYEGPLDGSSLFEQALSELTGPGRILVAAAGNGGFDPIHAGGQAAPAAVHEAFVLPQNKDRASVNMWYAPGAVDSIAIGFYRPAAGAPTLLGVTDPIPAGEVLGLTEPVPIFSNGNALGYLSVDAATMNDERNGDGQIQVTLTDQNDPGIDLSRTLWSVIIYGAEGGRQDLWANDAVFSTEPLTVASRVQWFGDSEHSIASPATAREVIAVGSYVSNNRFINILGRERIWENPTREGAPRIPDIGQRSYFSGVGPSRDGRTLPHITAPGEVILSLLSSHMTPGKGYDVSSVQEGGNYLALEGTSIAAAHVTGAVAGMLAADPELTPDLTRRILEETADVGLQTGATPNNGFGAGKLNAEAALQRTAEIADGTAQAQLDVEKLAGYAPPGIPIEGEFVLQNTGAVELAYSLSVKEPVVTSSSGKTTISAIRDAAVDRMPRPLFDPRIEPGNAGAKAQGSSRTVIQGQDVLMYDDGDHRPDTFWGQGDGMRQFFWGNHFVLDDFDFQLEKVQFYARTEEVAESVFWIGVYRSPFILNLLAGKLVEVSTSPEGDWYEAAFETPLSFARGSGLFIEVSAPQGVVAPAGVDAASAQVGHSYFAQIGARYQNLETQTSSGVEQGAFLVRGIGTATRNINLPPTPSAILSAFTAAPMEEIQFDASSSSDPDGQITTYRWDFGDGTISEEVIARHAYETTGIYSVSLTISDNLGNLSQASGEVHIIDEASSSRLVVTPTDGVLAPGESQLFDVSFDTEDLENGIYQGRIDIVSNAGFLNLPVEFDVNQVFVSNDDEAVLPDRVRLEENYPNPFNPKTVIAYEIPDAFHVQLGIYDAMGRRVRLLENELKTAGRYEIIWDATDDAGALMSSGVYFYRLRTRSGSSGIVEQIIGKMILLK